MLSLLLASAAIQYRLFLLETKVGSVLYTHRSLVQRGYSTTFVGLLPRLFPYDAVRFHATAASKSGA
jgi:hypothetical protein